MANPFKSLFSINRGEKALNHITKPGFYDMSIASPYSYYRSNEFENAFGSISVIANRAMVVEPYAVDQNGKALKSHPIIDALYHPNADMDAVEFREALTIFSLVHNKTYIHVHTRTGRPTVNTRNGTPVSNITGFTILQGVTEIKDEGGIVTTYQVNINGHTRQYTTQEVMVLKGINPYNLQAGYSPSAAARKWIKLDDYIAEYQAGFFENGAVPKGQLVITAPTVTEFRDIKNALESHHKGAGKNNNISYAFKPIDSTGKPQNAQIEWVPFAQTNASLELGSLFEQVNKKIDSAYTVPASMRADNDNNTYSSVLVDERILIDNTLRPRLIKMWGKFSHELNRITGGTGIALTFDLESPNIADEDKIAAEARKVDTETLKQLKDDGYTHKSAVEYLRTGDLTVLKVDTQSVVQPITTTVTEDEPTVDNGDEVIDSAESKSVTELKKKELTELDRTIYERQVEKTVKRQLDRQVGRAISQLDERLASKAYGDDTEQEVEEFTEDLLAEMLVILSIYGAQQNRLGEALVLQAGLSTEDIKPFYLTIEKRKEYRTYLKGIASYFNTQTADMIREVLSNGLAQQLSKAEIESSLRQLISGGFADYRATRLARTEVVLANGKASVISMQNIQRDTGFKVYKVWASRSLTPCPFCKTLIGTRILVNKDFVGLDEHVHGEDGEEMVNNWRNIDTGGLHANCECFQTYEVER